jgi:hypothetical protein
LFLGGRETLAAGSANPLKAIVYVVGVGLGVGLMLGCSSPSTGIVASCTLARADGTAGPVLCQEVSTAGAATLKSECAGDGGAAELGTFSEMGCSQVGAVGGCRPVTTGLTTTTWYYASGGATREGVAALCSASGATFIAPASSP